MSETADHKTVGGYLRWLQSFARRHSVRSTLGVTAVLSIALYLFPGVDLAMTRLFYSDQTGFYARHAWFLVELRALGLFTFQLACIAGLVSLIGPLLFSGARVLLPARAGLFITLSALLGPGLVVNVILKGLWGRARPSNVYDFGGDHVFTPPWVISNACEWNCSFVSGEASSSMMLIAFAMIAPLTWRVPMVAATLVYVFAMSLNRIAFGGHFLSDVVLGWLITLTIVLLVHRMIYRPGSPLTEEAIAGALGRTGDRIKAGVARGAVLLRDRFQRLR
jgi:lipid A 4'-phosphatase